MIALINLRTNMLLTQTHAQHGSNDDGPEVRPDIVNSSTPPVAVAAPTTTNNPAALCSTPASDLGSGLHDTHELGFADQIAQASNSATEGVSIEVDEQGNAVLDEVLTSDGVVPIVRNGIDPVPSGASFRLIPAKIDELEAIEDLGALAVALNLNMVRGDTPRALALLNKVKDLNPAGMAAFAWGIGPLLPPPTPKPKVRSKSKPRHARQRVTFPNLFAAIDDNAHREAGTGEVTPPNSMAMEVKRGEPADRAEVHADATDAEGSNNA
ncbi:hypothetical protein [Phenylobacterium conjunctum]|uniref:Uncharacterized protein n=1 Tax=Phenylobacterium conjunctum TaxID=1298959 RepID=A0ABW3T0Y9_9CAUL